MDGHCSLCDCLAINLQVVVVGLGSNNEEIGLDSAVFYVPPTQYGLCGRWFLRVKRPNQQYQSTGTEGTNSRQTNQTYNKQT